MKRLLTIFTLTVFLAILTGTASATTYSGSALSGLHYSGHGATAQYVAGTPDVAQLYTADLSTSGISPAVFVMAPLGTLSAFSGSYVLSAGTTVDPYWILWLTDDSGYTLPILTTDGGPINGSSLVHAGDLTHGSITLSALDALIDPNSGLPYGQSTIAWAGLEIGDGGSGPGTANIESITVTSSVPEPATMLLLGLGLMGIAGIRRKLRS